ncbi:putative acetyltransferase, GNAT [Actinorhabdospora filicis]|uniref:Acetyltransferase, GNAT n=1 Tax=Actinorhabdospora filicis TaxID=1785913 RepID=A0A9W6SN86_9ACTN|nr:GNAT family N-acetyltransferase [Actinorhabdospora filicis]GLZ79021.1 putative acetyltransferase, GNAT [Actinorhabdospora filicis]
MIKLPPRYTHRPATTDDIPAVTALADARERHFHGLPHADPGDVAATFARPALDPATRTLLVHGPDGDLAAWAWAERRGEIHVHPAHTGHGLGTALLDWAEGLTAPGRFVQSVTDADTAAVEILTARGYTRLATAWLLEIGLDGGVDVPEVPGGVTVRPFADGDGPGAHTLMEDAFAAFQPRRKDYAEWAEGTVARETFAPWASPIAFENGEPVGAVVSLDVPGSGEGYIERVAVREDRRGRGIARLLLRHAFAAFAARGLSACTLWTHSETGALALYERVGMRVRRSATVHARDLA